MMAKARAHDDIIVFSRREKTMMSSCALAKGKINLLQHFITRASFGTYVSSHDSNQNRCGHNPREPSLRDVLLMKVEVSTLVMAANYYSTSSPG